MKYYATSFIAFLIFLMPLFAQLEEARTEDAEPVEKKEEKEEVKTKTLYGTASYYADKFNGRKTANGETYSSGKLTAACNVLPLGTWIKVTNLKNNKSIIVKVNDRLHPRMKRIVDISRIGAEKLGYINRGLTNVKVEVVKRNK
jgi:rare lipoprotein A